MVLLNNFEFIGAAMIFLNKGFYILILGFISSFITNKDVGFRSYSPVEIYSDTIKSGKELAQIYCQRCHLFPKPELLDKKTWVSKVLPDMGLRLGIKNPDIDVYKSLSEEDARFVRSMGVYPEEAIISDEKWNKIVAYYEKEAPAEPYAQHNVLQIENSLSQFSKTPVFIEEKPFPQTTMLKFDSSSSQLYVGDGQNYLYTLNPQMKLIRSRTVASAPVDIDFPKDVTPRLLSIGVFTPSDQKLGSLISLDKLNRKENSGVNFTQLPRPVQFATGDLNMDQKEDVVICGFGNVSGKLTWFEDFDPEKEHVLKAFPGAIRVEIKDFNNDNRPDIMVMMTQAYEQVSIFYNKGNNEFSEKVVLSFPPVYGLSNFETVDFNNDGFLDILLTNGDNWDLSSIRKNYHGLRIYLNDGLNNFEESFFYPLYGATKAMARDFDKDGDLDIVAISFYGDLDMPEQGFIYLSNKGNLNFEAFSTPEAAEGKWLTMEVADFDKDGDLDIVLGSYIHNLGELTKLIYKGVLSFPQLLVLTNNLN